MIVMKFGGTSVEDARAIDRTASIVRARLPLKPVVVVSAMAKVTDTLLAMARAAGSGDRDTALQLSRSLRERHYNTAGELLGTGLFTQFHSKLEDDFDALDELLRGIAAVGELTPRTTDHVASYGELLSSKIIKAAFSARGLSATLVDSRECIVTDNAYTRAVPIFDETNEKLRTQTQAALGCRQDSRDERVHCGNTSRGHDDHRTWWVGLFGCDRGRRAGSRADRDMDRRGRHDDHRPEYLS